MIHKKRQKILIILFLLLSICSSAWLYRDSFSSYYFQDDWFSFKISSVNGVKDFLNFFVPRKEVIYYRPFGMQLPFFLIKTFFGFNSLPFRVLSLATHSLNIILVFILVRLLLKKNLSALISSFLYATSAVHYIPFFWSATYAFILGPTCFFLSFILILLFFRKRKIPYFVFSLLFFSFGLLVNEMVAVIPVIIFFYLLIFNRLKLSAYLLPYVFLVLSLFLPRFIFYPPSSEGFYRLYIGKHIFSNLKTYLLWSFNWSEILTEQMVKPFIFNKILVEEYSPYIIVSLVTFSILFFIIYLLSLILIKFRLGKNLLRLIIFGLVWFITGLSTVVLFPFHKYPYYLPISLVGLLLVSVCLIDRMFNALKRLNRISIMVFLVLIFLSWVLTTESSFNLNSKIHWAPRRAKIAKRLIEKAKKCYKYPFEDLRIYVGKTSENKWALNGQDAFRSIYEDDRIKTIYTGGEGGNVL